MSNSSTSGDAFGMKAPAEPTATEAPTQHQSPMDQAKDAARKVLGIITGTASKR
jgi:hypothetical protein